MPRPLSVLALFPTINELVASLAALLLASGLAWTPRAEAADVVSYQVEAGLPGVETIGGTTMRPSDAVDMHTNALVFDAFGTNPFAEDLDAVHIRANGNVIFSTDTDVNQAFPGLPNGFLNGDLVEWDGSTASIFFSESNFTAGGNPNISAFYLFESGPNAGKLLLGTKGADDVLGGLAFEWGNLLLYDIGSDTSSLFFDQDLISGTLTQKLIDGVHVRSNGNLVLSTSIDNGLLGGLTLRDQDLIEYVPGIDTASLFIDGDGLFDGATRDIDAFSLVPEPSTFLLIGLGMLGLAGSRRQRQRVCEPSNVARSPQHSSNTSECQLFPVGEAPQPSRRKKNFRHSGKPRSIVARRRSALIPQPLEFAGFRRWHAIRSDSGWEGDWRLAGPLTSVYALGRGTVADFRPSLRRRCLVLVALLLIWGTSANATTIVSYQRPPDVATIGGTTVRAADLVDVDSSGLVFDAFGTNPTFEDVNAAHLLSDGRILFSTVTSATIDGQSFTPGDLILYDATAPDTMKASLYLDGSAVFTNLENVDAIFLFEQGPNQGKVLLSTALSASIGALSFGGGDLILTDVAGVSPQLFFDGTTLISGTAGQKEVDAVHLLENGHLLLSINQNGGSLAGFALREQDLVEYDPAGGGSASLFLDGDGLFDGTTVDLNAVTSVIPEPGTLSLLAIGLLGLAFHRRR